MPLLSVIVNTYNREKLLDKCLASLCAQELGRSLFEVIVVDNNSEDATETIASRYLKEYKNIRYVNEQKQGESYSKNRGCEEACTEYLVYIDDDAKAAPDYLSNLVEVINKYTPDMIGGPVYPYYTEQKPYWFRDEFEIRKYENASGFSKNCRITGANFIIRKSVLRRVGMFHPELGAKPHKMGFHSDAHVLNTYRERTPDREQKVYYALECYVMHHVPLERMRFSYLMRRSFNLGRSHIEARALTENIKVGSLMLRAIRNICGSMWHLVRGTVMQGPNLTNYILICRDCVATGGMVTEALSRIIR